MIHSKGRWWFLGLLLALILGAGLSACTTKKAAESNTLYLEQSQKIRGLDPLYAGDTYIGIEVGRVYDSLLEYHYLKRPYELSPALAESLPAVSADGKTYVFKLKKGILFQNDPCFKATEGRGREVVAQDVVYSFLRHADPRLNSTGWWIFDGKIEGLNEWRDGVLKTGRADYAQKISGLQALDSTTLQITLKQRSSSFLYALAMPLTSIVPREAVEFYGSQFPNHPVGTGPFRLQEFTNNTKIVWVRNPTYRADFYPSQGAPGDAEAGLLKDAGKPLPLLDKIVVQVYEETQPMWLNFLSGTLDRSQIPKDLFSQVITPAKELAADYKKRGIRLIKAPFLDVTYLGLNMEDPLLGKNKLLRKALSLAHDPSRYIDIFFLGRALPAQGPIPPGLLGYDAKLKNPSRQFNLARAKEMLAQAGYPEGRGLPTLRFYTASDTVSRQISEFLQQSFSAIGVKLEVESSSWTEFSTALRNRKAQIFSKAWSADYPDAENFLQLFYSKNASPGPNETNYSNPEYDRLYEQALVTVDAMERAQLYQKMVALVVEDCPWIFGVHRIGYRLTQPWFVNYKIHDFDHGAAKYYRVEPH